MGLFGSAPKAPEPKIMPEFRDAAKRAGQIGANILDSNYGVPYGGDWVADPTKGQLSLIDKITKMGMGGGSGVVGGAQQYALDVMNGKYLDQNNPYLAKAAAAAQDQIARSIGGQFAGSGMAGSPAHLQYMTQEFSNAAAPLYFQNYQNERANQAQMASLAPQLDQAGYYGLNQGLNAQGLLQSQQQAEFDAERAKYDQAKGAQMARLQGVMGALGGQMSPQMLGGSAGSKGMLSGILQGGMGGAMTGSAAGPWGAIAGGLLGGAGGGAANK